MVEQVDYSEEYRVYAISRSDGGPQLLLLYILLAWVLLSVTTWGIITIIIQVSGDWGRSISAQIQENWPLPGRGLIMQLAVVLGTVALIPVAIEMHSTGSEEITYRIRDYMWGSEFRPYFIPLRGIVLSVSALKRTYVLPIALTYILSYFVRPLLPVELPPNYIIAGVSFVLVHLIFGTKELLSYRRRIRIQQEVDEESLSTLSFRHGVTAYIPGFVGLDNGDVYVEESEIFLKARSRKIVTILRHGDYLLVNDSKGDVFMWRGRGDSWNYTGHLQWVGDDVQFSTENGSRYGFSRLWIFGDQLRFYTIGNYYFTYTIGERMRVRRFRESFLADIVAKDRVYYLLKEKKIYPPKFYVVLKGDTKGELDVGQPKDYIATRRIYCDDELWVNLGARIFRYSLPSLEEKMIEFLPVGDDITYNPVRTDSLPGFSYSPDGESRYLLTDLDSDVYYRFRHYTKGVYYLDESSVHVSYQNVYYRLPLSSLEEMHREDTLRLI